MMNRKHRNSSAEARQNLLSASSPFYYSEAYKMLRTNLNFVTGSINGCKKIAITSSAPDEGKSIFAINLAITLAETGARVLLVDCDLRNPSIHRYLRVRDVSEHGLSSLLSGGCELNDCVFLHPKYKFNFVVAGAVPPNPNELLGSSAMENLVLTLKDSFDYILFDTPPAGIVADALVLNKVVDGTILVVRQGVTRRNQVRAVKQSLLDVGANIFGVVLNCCDMRDLDSRYVHRGRYYRYDYGYSYSGKSEK